MTKAAESNVASGRTLERTGFRTAGVMRRRRRGLRSSIEFERGQAELTPLEARVADDLSAGVTR